VARPADRKSQILRKAAQVFLDQGYEAASMDRIAEEVGITKPGLYYHYASKQDLMFSIMSYAMDLLEEETREAVARVDPQERLREIVYRHAHMLAREDDGAFTILVIDETKVLRPDDFQIIQTRKRAYFELLRSALRQLAAEGRLRALNPTAAAFGILGMIMWLPKWYRPNGPLSPEQVAAQIADQALSSLLEPAEAVSTA
jgi:AcrR family transcriptional regulator